MSQTEAPAGTGRLDDAQATCGRSNNKHAKITGALLIAEDTFVQTMEGEEAAVRALFDHIPSGPVPRLVSLLECGDVDIRVFPRWAMAKVAEDGEPDIPLIAHTDRISPAAAPITSSRRSCSGVVGLGRSGVR